MTIEALLQLPVERIEQMSDAALDELLSRYYPTTRPQGPTIQLETDNDVDAIVARIKAKNAAPISTSKGIPIPR